MTKATRSAKALASPPSASATPGPCLLPPFLLSLGLLEPYLGFTSLMDCRAVCREMARRFEKTALAWLERHLSVEAYDQRVEERRWAKFHVGDDDDEEEEQKEGRTERDDTDEGGEEEEKEREPMSIGVGEVMALDSTSSSQKVQSTRPRILFTHAVLFRQHLDRWRLQGAQCVDDALRVVVSPLDSWWAMGYRWEESGFHLEELQVKRSIGAFRLIDLFHWALVRRRTVAADDPESFKEAEKKRRSSAGRRADQPILEHMEAEDAKVRRTIRRWMRSSTGAPLLLSVPADVLVHFLLPCLDFEPLMGLRSVSRAFKPLAEKAAVLWCNRRFPEGLVTIRRLQQAEAEGAAKKPKKKAVKATGKWKRGSEEAQTAVVSSAAATYLLADAVWVRQQLLWARRLDHNQRSNQSYNPRLPPPVGLCKTEALAQYPLQAGTWEEKFPSRERARKRFGGHWYDMLDCLGLILAVHGHASEVQRLQQKRSAAADRRDEAERARKKERVAAVNSALAAVGLKAVWQQPGRFFDVGGIRLVWATKRRAWRSFRVARYVEDAAARAEEALLHQGMEPVGLSCAQGCWWRQCPVFQ